MTPPNGQLTRADRESLLRIARLPERTTKNGLAEGCYPRKDQILQEQGGVSMNAPPLQTERPPISPKDRTAKDQTFPTFEGFLPRARKLGNNTEGGPHHV